MSLVTTDAPSTELLSVEEAKLHLRLMSSDFDGEVSSVIRAARDWCERFTNRTFRQSVTRELTLAEWWPTIGCISPGGLKLPWPPLLTVESVAYYDSDNNQQTLDEENYAVELSTEGGGKLYWVSDATIPSLFTRQDAVTVEFTAGYANADTLPPVVLQAMKLAVSMLWPGREAERDSNEKAIRNLLAGVDWTGYA